MATDVGDGGADQEEESVNNVPPRCRLLDLPQDLFDNILFRVPVNALTVCRNVCNRMRSFLSHPDFPFNRLPTCILLHATERDRRFIATRYVAKWWGLYSVDFNAFPHNQVTVKLPVNRSFSIWDATIVGSCNDLLCVTKTSDDPLVSRYYIYSPLIGDCLILPPVYDRPISSGFGFSVVSEVYKIILIISPEKILILSVGVDKNWRSVSIVNSVSQDRPSHGVYFRGSLNWISEQQSSVKNGFISSFDVERERFHTISLPSTPLGWNLNLGVFENCLYVIHTPLRSEDKTIVWQIRDYPIGESWEIVYFMKRNTCHISTQLLKKTSKDQLLLFQSKDVLAHTPGSAELSRVTFDGIGCLHAAFEHVPSFRSVRDAIRTKVSLPPLPVNRTVLGVGTLCVDFLASVASYPNPDDKIKTTSFKVQAGGNASNALTCAARLGLSPRLISKVADDTQGRALLQELQADSIDTCFVVVSKEGNSPLNYIIVDEERKTRTCIHTPGYPPLIPSDLSPSRLTSALDAARILYLDGRVHETSFLVAQKAACKNVPVLIDAECIREGLDDLLNLADYAICSAKFPRAWTEAASVPSALVSMLLRLPKIKFAIVTLGEDGCIMLERSVGEDSQTEEMEADNLLESLKRRKDDSVTIPTCISSPVTKLKADGIGTVFGRLFVGTAEKVPPQELLDTTGAGDSFTGAILYAICTEMPPDKMLPFAAQVAGTCCRHLGARAGLPFRANARLAAFLRQG